MSGQWAGSTSAQELPADWDHIRQQVSHRAGGRCEGRVHGTRCPDPGGHCDHIKPRSLGGSDELRNLQWLCEPCHARKTAREAAQARAAIRALRKRPTERHPGATR